MFKFAVKQFINNLSVFIGFFLTLLLSSVLLATLSLLAINSIYAANGGDPNLKKPDLPIALFSSLSGLVFFLAIFALFSNINLAVRIQWNQFVLLRILGCTDKKIKFLIFIENLIIALLCTGLSILIAVPLANLTINFLKNFGALENSFHLYQYFKYQWIYVLSNLFLIIIITYFATSQIKKISIIDVNSNFQGKRKWFKLMLRLGFGLSSLAGAIAIISIKAIMVNRQLGAGAMFPASMCFIIAFGCLGQYFIRFFSFILTRIFPYYIIKNAVKAIIYNIKKFFFALVLFVTLILFINFLMIFGKDNMTDAANKGAYYLLTIIIALFDGIMVTNATFQYFWNRQKEFQVMRIIGFSKVKIVFIFLTENLVLNLIAFVFSFILIFYFNYQYSIFNNGINLLIENISQFFLINTAVFVTTMLISMMPMVFLFSLKRI